MCETCGCGETAKFKVHDPRNSHDTNHDHGNNHSHDDGHHHFHTHEHTHDHTHEQDQRRVIDFNIDILADNNTLARENREYFEGRNVLSLNIVSSPGSGKTSILERTIKALIAKQKIFVIEGDQQTLLDAERIEKSGAHAIQINTGTGCHLDAKMVEAALKKIDVGENSILFIENVGNLVCPALFDLGEFKRVVVISVTEGEDKPLKYPYMFQSSNLCIINKSDLLPYVDFNPDTLIKYARFINPNLQFIVMSAKSGEGINLWYEWITEQILSVVSTGRS